MKLGATAGGRQRGQSLVELTLVLPFLLLILFGIVDLGRVFNAYIVITNAAREGAFYASANPADLAGIRQQAVNEAASSGVSVNSAQVTVPSGLNGTPGNPITVQVAIPFRAVSAIIGSLWGGGDLTLSSATVVIIR